MSNADDSSGDKPRTPRAFRMDDPALAHARNLEETADVADIPRRRGTGTREARTDSPLAHGISRTDLTRGIRWGSLMLSAMLALASLAAGLWFTRFVTQALERQDWIGWVAFGLMSIIVLSGAVMVLKELWGLRRLARLANLRKAIREVQSTADLPREREVVNQLAHHYAGRPDLKWGLARLKEHAGDVLAPGDLLRLADRELLGPIDVEARRVILKSSRRVATVTALSPMVWIAMGYVMVENVRMFRALASLYGGKPGLMGALRLGRLVVTHIIATGGLALTDDLLGQFLGQDALRRLSRRLGEGAFNGALTARMGVAAIDVIRPAPFLDTEPIRVREIFSELMRSLRSKRDSGDQPLVEPSR